jgi:queuine/archaeosine tRNA-ribosyltransferase
MPLIEFWSRGSCISKLAQFAELLDRVDTCTELLPEKKPRYVMGVVGQ